MLNPLKAVKVKEATIARRKDLEHYRGRVGYIAQTGIDTTGHVQVVWDRQFSSWWNVEDLEQAGGEAPPRPVEQNERVHFRMFDMPCCGHMLCWVNPQLPSYCPECGEKVYMRLKADMSHATISDEHATLKYNAIA
jgi:hypothetical protein